MYKRHIFLEQNYLLVVGEDWLPWETRANSAEFLFYVEHHKIKLFHHHAFGMETEVIAKPVQIKPRQCEWLDKNLPFLLLVLYHKSIKASS